MFFPYFYLLMFYQCGTVFQTAFLTTCCNPETTSRVTLALLGTVFQTALTVLLRLRLSRHVQNLSRITWMRRICSSRIFLFWICMRLSGAGIFTDYHLLGTVFQIDYLFCGLVVL